MTEYKLALLKREEDDYVNRSLVIFVVIGSIINLYLYITI